MKKTLSFLLIFILLFSARTSCANESVDTGGRAENIIPLEKLSDFKVIYPKNSDKSLINEAAALSTAINNKFGTTLNIADDSKESEYEILIGKCDRKESEAFYVKLNDYGYDVAGTKIIICGGNDNATVAAVKHFIEKHISNAGASDENFFVSQCDSYLFSAQYDADHIQINGIDISRYTIVYNKATDIYYQSKMASHLADKIKAVSGDILKVVDDKIPVGEYEIRIGATNRDIDFVNSLKLSDDEYYVGLNNSSILVAGNNTSAIVFGTEYLINLICEANKTTKKIDFAVNDERLEMEYSKKLSVMSYNILYKHDPTGVRYVNVINTILEAMPDILGVQECTVQWRDILDVGLKDYYISVGLFREKNGTAGEATAIYYRKDKFTLIEEGTRWLSATPDKPSKVENSSVNRIMTYVILRRNSDGAEFMHINTHLDNMGGREEQTQFLLDFAATYEGTIFITGDFNEESKSNVYNKIISNGYKDSMLTAAKVESTGKTYTGTRDDSTAGSLIDYIFYKSEDIQVNLYRIIAKLMSDGLYPSDHCPVYVEFILIS